MIGRLLTLTLFILFMGCSAHEDGVAPSIDPDPVVVDLPAVVNDHILKNGETIITSGGWEASIDSTDSIEQVILANGWVIEVKNE